MIPVQIYQGKQKQKRQKLSVFIAKCNEYLDETDNSTKIKFGQDMFALNSRESDYLPPTLNASFKFIVTSLCSVFEPKVENHGSPFFSCLRLSLRLPKRFATTPFFNINSQSPYTSSSTSTFNHSFQCNLPDVL